MQQWLWPYTPAHPTSSISPTAAQKCAAHSADAALRGLHKEWPAVDLMDVRSHLDVLTIGLFSPVALLD